MWSLNFVGAAIVQLCWVTGWSSAQFVLEGCLVVVVVVVVVVVIAVLRLVVISVLVLVLFAIILYLISS